MDVPAAASDAEPRPAAAAADALTTGRSRRGNLRRSDGELGSFDDGGGGVTAHALLRRHVPHRLHELVESQTQVTGGTGASERHALRSKP